MMTLYKNKRGFVSLLLSRLSNPVLFGILIIAIIYFGVLRTGAGFDTADPQSFTTSVDGVPLQGTASWVINGEKHPAVFIDEVRVFNSYTEGNVLVLNSGGNGENGIKVSGTFPKGTLKVTCDLYVQDGSTEGTPEWVSCMGDQIEARIERSSDPAVVKTLTKTTTINTDNTNVEVVIWSHVNQYGYSNNKATLDFTPDATGTGTGAVVTTQDVSPTYTTNADGTITTSQQIEEPGFFAKIWNWIKGVLGIE